LKTAVTSAIALLISASTAVADPFNPPIITTPGGATQTVLYGSDTLDTVMDDLLAALIASGDVTQITTYGGIGSSGGERQLEGSPSSEEPPCTPNDPNGGSPDGNPGCQEISPMSRHMDSSICDDEVSSGTNTTAEGLAVCADGLVVITDNKAHRQYADNAAACPAGTSATDPSAPLSPNFPVPAASYGGTGALRSSGTIPGTSYTIADWRDVLRVIYAGCLNNQGTCVGVNRITRCSAATNTVRQALMSNWGYIFESGLVAGDTSVDCPEGNCCTDLRQAYRRDDSSGTTGVFLDLLGLANTPSTHATPSLAARGRVVTALGACQGTTGNDGAPLVNHIFCDGGDLEGFWPVPAGGGTFIKGDPIDRPCLAEDDLCGPNGRIGIVRGIRSPQTGGYPPVQCTKNRFARKPYLISSSCAVCPDGTVPSGGTCWAPYYAVDRNGDGDNTDPGDRDFNCLNGRDSVPNALPITTDGRSYNSVWRDSDGNLRFIPGDSDVPQVAQWRQNMAVLRTGISVPGGAFGTSQTFSCPNAAGGTNFSRSYAGTSGLVCQETSATTIIGCLTANTSCTLGWAGREAALSAPHDDRQEAARLNGFPADDASILSFDYPFARELFVNAIGGFENIEIDCLNRGGSAAYCADQIAIAQEFYDMTPLAQTSCSDAGYIPLPSSRCVGAQGTTGTPACGKPTVQAKTECLPQ
jgi:hypothetical protein